MSVKGCKHGLWCSHSAWMWVSGVRVQISLMPGTGDGRQSAQQFHQFIQTTSCKSSFWLSLTLAHPRRLSHSVHLSSCLLPDFQSVLFSQVDGCRRVFEKPKVPVIFRKRAGFKRHLLEEIRPLFFQSVFFSSLCWFAFNDVFISHHPPGGFPCQAYPCQRSDHANPISVIF